MSKKFIKKCYISGPLVEFRSFYMPVVSSNAWKFVKDEEHASLLINAEYSDSDPTLEKLYDEGERKTKSLGSIYRTKANLKRVIFANIKQYKNEKGRLIPPFFLTLTFEENITDLKYANREFTKFIMRVNTALFKNSEDSIQYVAVPQFQKRGAVHYHVLLFNLPFIEENVYSTIRDIWGLGEFVNLKKVDDLNKTFWYMSRYMEKDFLDGRLYRKRKYFCSTGLKKTVVINDYAVMDEIHDEISKFYDPVYEGKIFVDFVGDIFIENYIVDEKGVKYLKSKQ